MISADLLYALREKDQELWILYTNNDFVGEVSEAWLIYCLMQAIRARGWSYRLWNFGRVEALISMPNPERTISFKGDTEIDVLLRAYLSALGSPDF